MEEDAAKEEIALLEQEGDYAEETSVDSINLEEELNAKVDALKGEFTKPFNVKGKKITWIETLDVTSTNPIDLSIERMLQLEGKEILVVRFDKLIKLVNLEDYSIMYSFDCPNLNGEVFFQYDEDRLVDNKYWINIITKTFETIFDTTEGYCFTGGIKLSNVYLYIQSSHYYETGCSYDSAPYLFVFDVNTKKNKKVNHSENGQMNAIDDHTFVKQDERSSDINSIDYCTY